MMIKMRSAGCAMVAAAALTLLSACTGSPGDRNSSVAAESGAGSDGSSTSASSTPAQSGSTAGASGNVAGGSSTAPATPSTTPKDTYVAPSTAPYPTPSGNAAAPANQTKVLSSLPGSSSAACAKVENRTTMRAGSVAAGNFQTARQSFSAQYGKAGVPELDLQVIPQHSKAMKKLTVRVDPLGGGARKTVTSTQIEKAGEWRYFALVLPVAKPGSYRLSMISGADKGCFDVTFAK